MDQERFVTIEEMEAATASLLENGKKVGADSWQQRVKNQTPHCGFGEAGTCCRICAMGPCRITPKSPRGICGCDVHGIVGRNFLKFTAGGAATHSDHGREIRRRKAATIRSRTPRSSSASRMSGASRPKARTSMSWRTRWPRSA